ncbi:MAG: SGNH/GDSL hydrolase family protein [Planctomycetes bacterium]|nr:SGNH/GDSL hydrolase family protein [Planctomycetota bacterium]
MPTSGPPPASRSARKTWLFRTAAVLIGLSPLVACEAVLTAFDWGRPSWYDDPFVGFSAVYPLFELDESGTRYEIPRSRRAYFRPESFASQKAANEYRIFCLGESTTQGSPYGIETSYTTWLELALTAADPSRQWEIVNCGGISYASYRLVPILDEVLQHQPDMIVIYVGQNEFLEDRTFHHVKQMPRALSAAHEQLARLRTYTLFRSAALDLTGRSREHLEKDKPVLRAEVDALLDYRGGLAQYHRDEKWREGVVRQYEFNLRKLAAMCRDAGVPLIFCNPVCNLRDCPPFKCQHRDNIAPAERERFNQLLDEARAVYATDRHQALAMLREAAKIDDRHAAVHYELGKFFEDLGMRDEARAAFIRAKEEDVCPLRILECMNEIVLDVARDTRTPLIDVRAMFDARSRSGIPGDDWLVDHVHPSFEGHQLIANALAEKLIAQRVLTPRSDWETVRQARYRDHLASLPAFYFLEGQERLRGQTMWAQGRARRERKPEALRPGARVQPK